MASLFGEFQLRELAANLDIPNLGEKLDIVREWHRDYHFGTLKSDNETSREQAYNRDIFGSVLGYIDKPAAPYTFEAKASTASGQIPDARIGWFDPINVIDRTLAVVELKGASVSLDRPQRGHGNLSPVQQGFKYRPQFRGCEFVVVSNFYELRLYNDNDLDFEVWTLDDLVDPTDDYIGFRVFYLILASERFVSAAGKTPTQEIMLDIRGKQEEIGRRFYKEYSDARTQLAQSIWLLNLDTGLDLSLVIEKAQKILDRFVFVCFAEDRGLLPEKTVARVLRDAEESTFGSIWSTFRLFFEAMDIGSDKLGISIGFNGGLFAKDQTLENLRVGDAALRKVANLSRYNFSEDLSVSILGHIFEQSITDLESLQAAASSAKEISESTLSLRKTSGVFYTPSHAVRGIIDGSLGRYLREAEARFIESYALRQRLGDKKYADLERSAYLQYQAFLHNLTVLDPACGSGAFLVGALDYLTAEHGRVARILGEDLLSSDDFVKLILQHNLFGVDVNPGSVEITKLSLWLKSARRGQKLTTLDSNIQCGNSLVSDPAIAGDAAFDWHAAFPAVMEQGGFDVVVGNPPYVDSETMVRSSPIEREHISGSYATARGNWDLFVPFYQQAFDLARDGGVCSMIVPNKIIAAPYALALREHIAEQGDLVAIADVSTEGIFEVDVYPVVVTAAKREGSSTVEILDGLGAENRAKVVQDTANGDWAALFHGMDTTGTRPLSTIAVTHAAATVSDAYDLKAAIRDDSSPKSDDLHVINTGTIDPYTSEWGLTPMRYIKDAYENPVVSSGSLPRARPWLAERFVVVAGMSQRVEAVLAEPNSVVPAKSTVVVVPTNHELDAHALLALLNSQPFSDRFIAKNQFAAMAGGYLTITKSNLGESPVPANLSSIATTLSSLGKEASDARATIRSETVKLKSVLVSELGPKAWTKHLRQWWELDAAGFLKALRVQMSLQRRAEFVEFHQDTKQRIAPAVETFERVRREIDQLVENAYTI